MDGATRLAVLVDAACLAPDGTPLSGAWAVWRAVTVTLGALPPDGRWSLRLSGQGDAAHTAASGSCVLSGFHARDSEDALKALRTLLGRIPETAGARQAASAAALPASFAAAAGDALAALAVLSPGDPDAPPRTQATAWLVVFARRDASACAALDALLSGTASRDALRVLWAHPDAAAGDEAFERAAAASALVAVLPLSSLCLEPPFSTTPAPLQALFDATAADAPDGFPAATAVQVGVQGTAQHSLGLAALLALRGAPTRQQRLAHFTCAATVPLDAMPAALLQCDGASTLHGATGVEGLEAAAHALGERASAALVRSAGGADVASAWGLLLPLPPGALFALKWLRAPPPGAGGSRASTTVAACGAQPVLRAVPRAPHGHALWAAASSTLAAAAPPRHAPAEPELAATLRAADACVRPATPAVAEAAAVAELVRRLRARCEGAAAEDTSPTPIRHRAPPRTPTGTAVAGDAAPHPPSAVPSAAPVLGAAGALDDAVAAAAAAVAQYVRTPSSDAVPVGEFAAELVARAMRAARASPSAGAPASWRQALVASLLLPPAALAARHPAGCEPHAKRREYTLQALLHLWLSLEPRADADGAEEVPSRARAAATQASSLLAHCALLLEPMGADGLTLFCDTHVAPALAAAAPVTTRRLHAALGIGAPGEAHPRDRGGVGEALTPHSLSHGLHALYDAPAEGRADAPDAVKSRRPAPRVPRGGGGEPGAGRGRGGASLRLRRVVPVTAAARPLPKSRAAPAAGAADRRRAAQAASPPLHPRARRAVALASPPVAASSGGGDDDGDDAVVPCTTLRRGGRGAEGHSPRRYPYRSPRRARALALFAAESPPPHQATQAPRNAGGAADACVSPQPAGATDVATCARCSGACLCALPQASPSDAAPRSRRRSGSRAAPPPPPSGSAGRKRTRVSDAGAVSPRRARRLQ